MSAVNRELRVLSRIIKKVRANNRLDWLSYSAMALSILLIAFGSVGQADKYKATHTTTKLQAVIEHPTAKTSEAPVDVYDKSYTVAPDKPRALIMPSIGVHGFIQQVGVTADSAIDAPNNINLAGWYKNSVKPGEAGLSIIDGHVSGKYQPAIFKNLQNLKTNDIFTIEFGDGRRKEFKVASIGNFTLNDANQELFKQNPKITNQLNLITCSGKFNKSSQSFEKRLIVVSRLVSYP